MSASVFMLVAGRDLRLAGRRRFEALLPVVFFIVAASLFPLGVGPEPQVLRQIAPGVVWVCALLAAMLSLNTLFASDHQDGSLEQMLLSRHSTIMVAAGKALAQLANQTPLFDIHNPPAPRLIASQTAAIKRPHPLARYIEQSTIAPQMKLAA